MRHVANVTPQIHRIDLPRVNAVDEHISERLQDIFATDLFRVYTNVDVVGCEVAGSTGDVRSFS